MNKYYITFGQAHAHAIGGKTFDRNCLAELEAESQGKAHEIAMRIFNGKFHNCHTEEELPKVIEYYPRGVIKV
jgi:hypothetical protein